MAATVQGVCLILIIALFLDALVFLQTHGKLGHCQRLGTNQNSLYTGSSCISVALAKYNIIQGFSNFSPLRKQNAIFILSIIRGVDKRYNDVLIEMLNI